LFLGDEIVTLGKKSMEMIALERKRRKIIVGDIWGGRGHAGKK